MSRPESPPPAAWFDRPRRPVGERRVVLALGPLGLRLAGLDEELETRLRLRFGPYVVADAPAGLTVEVEQDGRDYFIDPPKRAEPNPVLLACDGPRVRYMGYRVAGWFDTGGGEGRLILSRGEYEPAERAVENYVRAAVAWQAASRGGALVHAAGAVLDGRGYLFYGPSGAGKSTLSACNRRGRVVSDDLSLVLPGAPGLELIGSPFRGTYEEGDPVVGRFPLSAGFRLVQAEQVAVHTLPRPRALAELVGNLPFVAEAYERRPDLFRRIEAAFAPLPLAHLHFRRDDSYWDAIRAAGY